MYLVYLEAMHRLPIDWVMPYILARRYSRMTVPRTRHRTDLQFRLSSGLFFGTLVKKRPRALF